MMEQIRQQDSSAILRGLQSTEDGIVRSAAFAAGDAGLAGAVDFLCAHIADSNVGVQEAAEYALRKIRGQRTIECMLSLLRSEDAPVRNIAMDILREIGRDSMESLQSMLHDTDPDMRIFIADILGCTQNRQAVKPLCDMLLKDPEVNVRYQAAISLGVLGFPESVDALAQAMRDEEWVQFAVVETLMKIRADSTINALVKSLGNGSELVCSIIVDALAELGNIKAVPLLFKSLPDVSEALRQKMVKAVVKILGAESLPMLSQQEQDVLHGYLLAALESSDEEVRHAAVSGLGALRRETATLPLIRYAAGLTGEENPLREEALRAIASIGVNQEFSGALTSDDPAMVSIVLCAASFMHDQECRDLIRDGFNSLTVDLRRIAAAYLADECGEEDAPFFLQLLESCTDAEILKNALYFLGIRFCVSEAEERIFGLLYHEDQDLKETALQACINMHSPLLNQHFKELLNSHDEELRMMALYALGMLDLKANLPDIIWALEDKNPAVRRLAVELFMQESGDLKPYMELLLPRFHDEDKDVRIALVELLGKSGLPEAVPYLLEALQDADDWVRIRAVEALGEGRCREACPLLARMREQENPMVVFKIIEALGKIGGPDAAAILETVAVRHGDPAIREAVDLAVDALREGELGV